MSISVSYRKSTVPAAKTLNGNGAKYLCCLGVWARIKLARSVDAWVRRQAKPKSAT